jgi:hypothetical protein
LLETPFATGRENTSRATPHSLTGAAEDEEGREFSALPVSLRLVFGIAAGQTRVDRSRDIVARIPMDVLGDELVAAIASELERRAAEAAGVDGLAERKDLEPAALAALSEAFPDRVQKDRQVAVPHWASVGHVDVVVRAAPAGERVSLLAELKWCGPSQDILYEGLWDLLKMALATRRDEKPHAYLITGAEKSLWRTSVFADLFEDREHDSVQLCLRELNDSPRRLAWDRALEGGYDRYPDAIPASIRTGLCGRATVGAWELRAVEVEIMGDDWVPMEGGWPYGRRPAEARRPSVTLLRVSQ